LMEVRFSGLAKPIRKNLVALSFAFLLVLSAYSTPSGHPIHEYVAT
jgi:ABC-type Co2+ transport system permease subunit